MSDTRLPGYEDALAAMAAAEDGDGWLAMCEAQGRFLVLNREFVSALAEQLRLLSGPVLEVCAGRGELARALTAEGVEVIATDAGGDPGRRVCSYSDSEQNVPGNPGGSEPAASDAPPLGGGVIPFDAREALHRYRPTTVLGCFVPFDAGVDDAVLAAPCVEHYVVINARLGGQLGNAAMWQNRTWLASPLPEVTRWMICRHDVWLGAGRPILRHGEAWLFNRRKSKAHG